jgi:hypothetical protein
VFPSYGPISSFWKIVMLIHSFNYAFIWPVRIATFEYLSWGLVALDLYCNAIFFIDIIINFLTPIIDKDGRIINNNKRIAKYYVRTWFFFDLLTMFPITYFKKLNGFNKFNDGYIFFTNLIKKIFYR